MKSSLVTAIILVTGISAFAQSQGDSTKVPPQSSTEWYKKINLRGYTQIRYNRLFETNQNLQCEQCDKSWGGDGGFFFRRIRLVFFGQVHERVYIYIQPDFASSAGNDNNFAQIRDVYFDLGLDKDNEFRFRIGQSKVPYGFENLQSSQNRIPLDRNDGINSAIRNERDMGIFFYWAPKKIRDRFSEIVNSGLKGSGDYGVIGLGVFNGQTANRTDRNRKVHSVLRISYPFLVGNQIIEPGIQGYTGRVGISSTTADVILRNDNQYADERVAASFILYPRPFGLSAEFNKGTGPEYDPVTNAVEQKSLYGGYVLASYRIKAGNQIIIPFARAHRYEGGKKFELDARSYNVKEFEVGVEWQPIKNFELVAMWTKSERRFQDGAKPQNLQEGSLLRIQAQFNY